MDESTRKESLRGRLAEKRRQRKARKVERTHEKGLRDRQRVREGKSTYDAGGSGGV
jgi:hypothetical protein